MPGQHETESTGHEGGPRVERPLPNSDAEAQPRGHRDVLAEVNVAKGTPLLGVKTLTKSQRVIDDRRELRQVKMVTLAISSVSDRSSSLQHECPLEVGNGDVGIAKRGGDPNDDAPVDGTLSARHDD